MGRSSERSEVATTGEAASTSTHSGRAAAPRDAGAPVEARAARAARGAQAVAQARRTRAATKTGPARASAKAGAPRAGTRGGTTDRAGGARSAAPPRGAGASRAPREPDGTRLGRDDWLDAAYDAVVTGGFDAVRVLPLAEALGVSRGSFYWHFDDHAALVRGLLDRWFERERDADRALEASRTADPVADLMQLLDAALARGGADLKAMRFELAIRTLGGQDPAIGRRLAEVDQLRMAVITEKFVRVVQDRAAARDLAALLYVAVAGAHQAMARTGSRDGIGAYLRGVIAEHLIRRVAAAAPTGRGGAVS